ncbi:MULTISPECIES: dicarboxylate/amino acid:cation symporter [Sphingomonas]|uniref:Na+/H+-dicarboxylate symporter n=1 Tax=Sphingomonas kyeonggiensis TaxID=1268553 RepID=A0A7W7NQT4_9SPHN|nr:MULTISPECIES: dicarboxylate/amino acid:cation symporter [Sphingomonas]MBB4838158.1 Na+/H+-dicarboxylate symporter [Sphingomonas kyeonggiensis]WHU01382.1 dicarboxylate/amino acid:cation symporter [Sphingomonas sp. NIBR02145]
MSQPTRILLSLIAGLVVGALLAAYAPSGATIAADWAQPIGQAWLNGLQMTIVPLVVALLITGVAATAEAAQAGRLAARAIALYVIVLALSATAAAILTPLFLHFAPLPHESATALRGALAGAEKIGPVPPIGDFLAAIIPANIVKAAAENAFLSLIIFSLIFAFAMTRVGGEAQKLLTDFFKALRDVMLVVIDWVLWVGPVGVFALALVVGAKAGTGAFGALIHYILIVAGVGLAVTIFAYPVAVFGGRVRLGAYTRAALPSQAVALSTQSSLATLPVMIEGSGKLGVPVAVSGVTLPLAVAIFRATGPAMNFAVAIYVAEWFGVPLSPATLAVGVVVATLTSLGSVSLPGTVSYVSAIAPVAATIGAPVSPLGLLVAVETLPDIMRTVGNVTWDIAATTWLSRRAGKVPLDEADAILAHDS